MAIDPHHVPDEHRDPCRPAATRNLAALAGQAQDAGTGSSRQVAALDRRWWTVPVAE